MNPIHVFVIAALVAAPSKPAPPPSPQAAARAAATSMPVPAPRAKPKPGERTWLPSSYSLSRDAGFTPWSTFLSLHDGRVGRWTLAGTSLGRGLRCEDGRAGGCVPLSEATVGLVWQPHGAPIGLYAGPSLISLPVDGEMQIGAGFSAGITITPASLATLARRLRAR